jgi:hypothetical protein
VRSFGLGFVSGPCRGDTVSVGIRRGAREVEIEDGRNSHQFSAMIALPRKLTFFLPRLVRPWRVARVLGMEERSLAFWRVRPILGFDFAFGSG